MYELIQVGTHSYYIDCPAKIGIVVDDDNNAYLIDSGNNKDAAKKIKKILDANGWSLKAIYNTHSHADHIGGNRYLQTQTGCDVYAVGIEKDFTCHPILESGFLYGGYPFGDLRHKFLLAEASDAYELFDDSLPVGMDMIALAGHSFDMVGFRTIDDVVYLADCLASKETLDKYGIPFIYDVAAYLQTLEDVKAMKASMFVPSHAPATADIAPLAQYNIDHVKKIGECIKALCEEPRTFEGLLTDLFDEYALTMTAEQYVLVGSTVRSFLAWLKDTDVLQVRFENNQMLWQTC